MTLTREQLSILALVASDQSYRMHTPGRDSIPFDYGMTRLESWPDSPSPVNDALFPAHLEAVLPDTGLTAHTRTGYLDPRGERIEFDNWVVHEKIEDRRLGFGALLLRSALPGSNEWVVAFQGTDGPDPIDWNQNLLYAKDQWNSRTTREALFTTLFTAQGPANLIPANGTVHFTGQSLGGGLAQRVTTVCACCTTTLSIQRCWRMCAPRTTPSTTTSCTGWAVVI